MRLLFDESLAPRLSRDVDDLYSGSAHISDVLSSGAPDRAVWEAACVGDFVLVTKDDDFHRLSILLGAPPF